MMPATFMQAHMQEERLAGGFLMRGIDHHQTDAVSDVWELARIIGSASYTVRRHLTSMSPDQLVETERALEQLNILLRQEIQRRIEASRPQGRRRRRATSS